MHMVPCFHLGLKTPSFEVNQELKKNRRKMLKYILLLWSFVTAAKTNCSNKGTVCI